MFSSVTKPYFITMANSRSIIVIIDLHTIFTRLNVIINIIGV